MSPLPFRSHLVFLSLLVACHHAPPITDPGATAGEDVAGDPVRLVVPVTDPAATAVEEVLGHAVPLVVAKRCEEAVDLIKTVDGQIPHGTQETRYLSSRAGSLAGMLAALAGSQLLMSSPAETVLVTTVWSDLLYARAVCEVELGRLDEAEAHLRWGLEFLPGDVILGCELGYVYQTRKAFLGALEHFVMAFKNATYLEGMPGFEEARDGAGPLLWGETLFAWKARALRGQGYCLIELGRFDEAEVIYRSLLVMDPSDAQAKREMEYIEQHRPR